MIIKDLTFPCEQLCQHDESMPAFGICEKYTNVAPQRSTQVAIYAGKGLARIANDLAIFHRTNP
jgi:hypothetical protein